MPDQLAPAPASPQADSTDDPVALRSVDTDGRRARRDRNKDAVVDAYLALVREGHQRPSVSDVAERSGISYRSVFRYFADRDELTRAAIERHQADLLPLAAMPFDPAATLEERIAHFVARRTHLYEVIAPIARLSRSLAGVQPIIEAQLHASRQLFRAQLRKVFAAELAAGPKRSEEAVAQVLTGLDLVTSFESWDLLRRDQALTLDQARATLRATIATLLGA
jgi:AcrR family transcriptional regulator